jgi:energy-coupling factor transporter ATP-binding protein EcfA2
MTIPSQLLSLHSSLDYPMFWKFIHIKGIELYGPKFVLYEEDTHVILRLLIYFLQDRSLAEAHNIDLRKGIMLAGPVGCGKTTLMNLMKCLLAPEHKYCMKPARNVAIDFCREGYEVIMRYTRLSFNPYTHKPITFCFDDLGLESIGDFYKNECNTMAEILLSRYDFFQQQQMLTHITTNLSAQEIQDRYGHRIRSRMREMFNLIAFDKTAIDKRQ